jgi:hypothetical protein
MQWPGHTHAHEQHQLHDLHAWINTKRKGMLELYKGNQSIVNEDCRRDAQVMIGAMGERI